MVPFWTPRITFHAYEQGLKNTYANQHGIPAQAPAAKNNLKVTLRMPIKSFRGITRY